jgi:hypothetical protein
MSLSTQELFDQIHRDSWQLGLSIGALSKKYGVHRRLVRTSPRMELYKKTVDQWLRVDLEAPRKQRHTAKRITAAPTPDGRAS